MTPFLPVLVACLFLLTTCERNQEQEAEFFVFGTIVEVKLWGASQEQGDLAFADGRAVDKDTASPDTKKGDSPIDPQALTKVLGDDAAKQLDILWKFLVQAERIIAEVDTACGQRDAAQISFLNHKLKSSARTVGADSLADLCLALEVASRKDDWAVIERLQPESRLAMERVKEYINGL